jgi:adenosine deaminase
MKQAPSFQKALAAGEINTIRQIPKADLHNHCLLGIPLARLSELFGKPIPPFRHQGKGIADINQWIKSNYSPLLQNPDVFHTLVQESFKQLLRDGITVAEMSIDAGLGKLINKSPGEIVETLRQVHREIAPHVIFRPGLGFARTIPVEKHIPLLAQYLAFDYFEAIDLYDEELSQPIDNFRPLYTEARKNGLRCTAHVGEFGNAEDVRHAAEVLELDAIQHGIAAASSPEVMQWLASNEVVLNICPTSNIVLDRVAGYQTHPIRVLFDHGVKVTVNTDDVTLFGQGVSEEFLHLYQASLFSLDELELIREEGLRS